MGIKLNIFRVIMYYKNDIYFECLVKSEYKETAMDRLKLLPFFNNMDKIDIYQLMKSELKLFKNLSYQLLTID